MEQFLSQFIKNRLLILAFFALCVVGGICAFKTLPIDAFPDLTNNQVQIITVAAGLPPAEAEQLVSNPIEMSMNGLPDVKEVRSLSKFGLSVVTVVFDDWVNTYFARQLVNERLQTVKSRLPAGVDSQLGPITTGMGEIYQYVVEGYGYSPMELKTIQDWDIRYQLQTVPGVNEVSAWGGFNREYHVVLNPTLLTRYGITLDEVAQALQNNNQNFNAGVLEHGSEQLIISGIGRVDRLNDIANIIVRYQNGQPVFIHNIGRVQLGHDLRQGAVTKDGKGEVVAGIVMMLKGENSRVVIHRIKDKIRLIQKSLPEGVWIRPFYDQTRLVEQTIYTVRSNLLEGGFLVVTVLLLMLGNVRAACIVAIAIPLSLMFSFMGMKALGITANIMSLGAIDFGMIVDGSIVMVENTLRKLSESDEQSQFEIIQGSVREMSRPILFGVLIITVVYLPILGLEGIEYKMFSPMAYTISFALLGSLLIALLLVPVLCSLFLKKQAHHKEKLLFKKLRAPYLDLLDKAIANRGLTVAIAVVLLLLTLATIPFLGTEFVPRLDEGDLQVEMVNLPSISLEEAVAVGTRIEQVLKSFPEVQTVVTKTGRADVVTDPMGVHEADIYIKLRPKREWRFGLTKDQLQTRMNDRLEQDFPGSNFNFSQPIALRVDEIVSGVKADVAIKLFGDDISTLMNKALQIEKVMATVPGNEDLQVEKVYGSSQLTIIPDRTKLALYGINISDVRNVVETAILGRSVSEVLIGRRRFTLRIRFPEGSMLPPDRLEGLLIQTADGRQIPVGQVSKIVRQEGFESLKHEFGKRRVIIQMNVRGRDMGSFVQEGRRKLAQQVALPPGYYIAWGGQFENQQRAMKKLLLIIPMSLLIIFLLLMATFSSPRQAMMVMLNVPFALIGGVLALWLRGMYFSVPAAIGFIALFGVAVLNGVVLVSTINKLLAESNLDVAAAIRQGCETRLRPVLMTAMVATLGFLPMALSQGAGAEIQKPLATVVIGGLITSTLLTLIVLPAVYSWLPPPAANQR